jgi:hypothetical protein
VIVSVIVSIRPLVFVAICVGVQYNADYDEAGHAFQAEAGTFFDPKPAGVPALIPSCGVGGMVFCFGFWVKWIVRACGVCICSRRRVDRSFMLTVTRGSRPQSWNRITTVLTRAWWSSNCAGLSSGC